MDNTSGRRWARFWLIASLLVSMVGNVAHTVLANSHIPLWLRVPGAVIWPLFTFAAIEILVRVIWECSAAHRFTRAMLIMPAVPAAITSYQHLSALLTMMGEIRFISVIGPLAIDGLMIGCTLTLLFTRPQLHPQPVDIDEVLTRWDVQERDIAAELERAERTSIAPVSPAPVSAPPAAPASRAPRAPWDAARVAQMVTDGEKDGAIKDATGASLTTIQRFRTVAKKLRADRHTEIDLATAKIRPEHLEMIREWVSR